MSSYQMATRLDIETERGKCELISTYIKDAGLVPEGMKKEVSEVQKQDNEIAAIAESLPAITGVTVIEGDHTEEEKMSMLDFAKTLRALTVKIRNPPSEKEKKDMQFVIAQMASTRFVLLLKTYRKQEYKKLFREEFIRMVYPLGEMPQAEVNDFIDVCNEMVMQYEIRCKVRDLEKMREEKVESEGKEAIALITTIDTTIIELNDKHTLSTKRVGEIKKGLGANREQRLKDGRPTGITIVSLIEAFQDNEKRESLMKLQQKKDKELIDTFHILDDMEVAKALVMGLSEEELLNGAL